VLRVARAGSRHADRAEAALAMSLGVGLRAKELTSLEWTDVYDAEGRVRPVLHLRAAVALATTRGRAGRGDN
jgi:integrase